MRERRDLVGRGGRGEGGRWAISWSRLARMGLMCGTITKRRSAWHEQFHVHIVLLFRGVLTSSPT